MAQLRLANQPQDRATAVDEKRQWRMRERATAADERGQRRRMREGKGGGQEVMKAGARDGLPGGRREATTSSAVDERCVVGERRWWQLTRGNDFGGGGQPMSDE